MCPAWEIFVKIYDNYTHSQAVIQSIPLFYTAKEAIAAINSPEETNIMICE